ncbi:MAG: glycoside hydrolase family 2 protein [Candidatus Spyradocola sp.]
MNAIPRPEHPRPDWQRKDWLNLNGDWEFDFSDAETCPAHLSRRIQVPFSWASPLSGVAEDRKGAAWYRRTARFSAPGEIFLILGAADYASRVFVNGRFAGAHCGGYDEIRLNVTALWDRGGENEIAVRVEDNDLPSQTRGKQGYGEIRGIWQTVYLEAAPATRLEWAKIETKKDGRVRVLARVRAEEAGPKALRAAFDGQTFGREVELPAGESNVELDFALENPRLWSPDEPNLYEGELCLDEDRVSTYFGVREIEARPAPGRSFPWILLNGKPVYLNGVLDQCFNPEGYFTLPSEEAVIASVQRAKDIGLNLMRLHIKPEEPRKLYWMDKLGMFAFADMVCFHGDPEAEACAQFEQELRAMLHRDCNHPCILAWIAFNETWGLLRAIGKEQKVYEPQTQEWVRGVYRRIKAFDPTRLVEDNSACNHDHVETDLNTWHFYLNGYMAVKEEIDTASRSSYAGSAWNCIGPNRLRSVPLMNSECGMVWGVQDSAGDSDLAWQYHYMLNEYRLHENLCGFVFTEMNDVVNEFNGYYRIDNAKKEFGYEALGLGMTLNDLHAKDFLAYDAPPCRTVGAGETVATPLYYSNFGGCAAGEPLRVQCVLHGVHGTVETRWLDFRCPGDGLLPLGEVEMTMPPHADAAALTFVLLRGEEVLSRNFCCLDVRGPRLGAAYVAPKAYEACSFAHSWTALSGHKLDCAGAGRVTYEIPLAGADLRGQMQVWLEASAKRELPKDRPDAILAAGKVDCVVGDRTDPGTNHNSYFMTDETRFPSQVRVRIEGEEVLCETLENDPADANGVLSWHYQKRQRYLDEAGSYGWLLKADVPAAALARARERGCLRLAIEADEGGLALYGRNAGRYPLDIELVPADENP